MKNPTVLLLEDEPVIAADLSAMLWGLGCEVLWAADSSEALALCALRMPDLAVLNFRQPDGTDGLALAHTLRAELPIKIFFVTGARPSDLCTSSSFETDFMVLFKPFTPQQFKAMLQHIKG